MTEQDRTAPVPGPPRGAAPVLGTQPTSPPATPPGGRPFADLEDRPVAEHVAVFEAEHARLQQQLSSIDQL
jgi:hypothetical protein